MLTLNQLASDLWVVDHSLYMLGVNLGTRSTLLRIADQSLCLISPGAGLDELKAQIDSLGEVKAILAPNTMHHLSLPATQKLFPLAQIYGPPGLKTKQPKLNYLGFENTPWIDHLQVLAIQGLGPLQEHAFFHAPSKTLIATDLVFNFQQAPNLWARAMMTLNGCYQHFGPTRVLRSLIKDPADLRKSIEQLLQWDFDRVIMAHGEVLPTGGKAKFRQSYQAIGILSA